jgi:CheY-like chemotaxis protein
MSAADRAPSVCLLSIHPGVLCLGIGVAPAGPEESSVKLRALVFEDEDGLREIVVRILERRGYEVVAFKDPAQCPLFRGGMCYSSCADVLITDLRMPNMSGLEFLEHQFKHGCKIKNVALMSGAWSDGEARRATDLGCRVFNKPFSVKEIDAWLAECEKGVDPKRVLSDACMARS